MPVVLCFPSPHSHSTHTNTHNNNKITNQTQITMAVIVLKITRSGERQPIHRVSVSTTTTTLGSIKVWGFDFYSSVFVDVGL